MSLSELHADLEAHMTGDGDDDPFDAPLHGFTIDTLEKADWAVRKVAQHRRRYAEAAGLAAAERARLDEWLAAEKHRMEQSTSFLVEQLQRYHRGVLDEDPKRKTITFPGGQKLEARQQPDTLTYSDEAAFIEWARASDHTDLLRVRYAADKAAVKKFTAPVGDSDELGHVETGEIVPGVTWQPGGVSFAIRTEDDL